MNKKLTSLYTPLVLILSINACSQTDQPQNYFPLNEGITWTYKIEQLTMTEPVFYRMIQTSLGSTKLDEQEVYVKKLHNKQYQYFNTDDSGLYQIMTNNENKISTNRYIYKYPLEMNTQWRAIGDPFLMRKSIDEINAQQNSMPGLNQDSPLQMEYVIESVNDSVKVPAGSFHGCLRVVGKGSCSFSTTRSFAKKMAVTVLNKEWYCPNVGLVRIERNESSERVSLKPVHYIVELEKIKQ